MTARPRAGDGDPFARQRLIPGWRQDALAGATAVVLGVGALGNEMAKNLALAGLGRLVLCDPDTVAESNRNRCVLFGRDDLGRPKVAAAAAALAGLGFGGRIDARQATLAAGVGLGEFADADLVLGCLDTQRSRLDLLSRCALVDARLVDGGTGPWSGEVRIRTDPDSACWSCTLSARERGAADLPRNCAEAQPRGEEPASIALTALVASWMTVTALRLLFGLPVPYQALRVEAAAGTTTQVAFTRDPRCLYHRPLPTAGIRLPLTPEHTVADLLGALPVGSDVRTWSAFPVGTKCRSCGTWSRYDSVYNAQSLTFCAVCGGGLRPRSSQWMSKASASARLEWLGVAPQDILQVRTPEGSQRWLRLAG
jgi:molybdopterin-synthase adenylyltransferase